MQFQGMGPQDQYYDEQYTYNNYNPAHIKQLLKICKKHRNQHVTIHLLSGKVYDGFLEFSDEQNIFVALPLVEAEQPAEVRNTDGVTSYNLERYRVPLASIAAITPYLYY